MVILSAKTGIFNGFYYKNMSKTHPLGACRYINTFFGGCANPLRKCMPKTFTWGPVSGASTVRGTALPP
jgi:hypothetical protein